MSWDRSRPASTATAQPSPPSTTRSARSQRAFTTRLRAGNARRASGGNAWDAPGLIGEQPLWGRFWELAALSPGQKSLIERARQAIADGLAAYPAGPDRYGLIHADLVPENLLIDGNRVRVIDFDDAGFGWHLFELATSLYFITGDSRYPTARDALIRGYRSERALPDAALESLPLFLAARGTSYLGWVHTRQGSGAALELTPFLIERACAVAEEYLTTG